MRVHFAPAFVFASLLAACAGSLHVPHAWLTDWHVAQMGPTRLIGDLPAEELEQLAGDLARFEVIFARLAGWDEGTGTTRPLTIHLIRDRELAAHFDLGMGIAGWAMTTLDASYITLLITSGRDSNRGTLFHEYTHVLLARNEHTPIPRWINEGLAVYFSTLNERSGAVVVGAAPGAGAERVRQRGPMPLAELMDASLVDMKHVEVADYYATSWALAHYLMASPARRRELAAYLKLLARGTPGGEAQQAAFGRSLEQLSQELSTHVAYLSRGVPIETLFASSAFATPEPPTAVSLAPREVAFALGSLALAMLESDDAGDWTKGPPLAHGLLSLARNETAPAAPEIEAAFAEALAWGGDEDAARAAVQSALARAPGDPRVHLRAARVSLLRAETESDSAASLAEAEQQFARARTLDPNSAAAWFGHGQTLVKLDRERDAIAAFETARSLGWSRQLDVARARLHLARGEPALAAELLRPIAQDPHGGAVQKEAAELLAQTAP